MSFEDALKSVVPAAGSWKKTHSIAEELRRMEIDPRNPDELEPHIVHLKLSDLVLRGEIRRQPALRSLQEERHSGFEYQRVV